VRRPEGADGLLRGHGVERRLRCGAMYESRQVSSRKSISIRKLGCKEGIFTRPFVCDISEDDPVGQLRVWQGCSSAACAIPFWMGVGVSHAKSRIFRHYVT
jgi:hypothetical protein